jgi:drug/metabolite transporter, DME family
MIEVLLATVFWATGGIFIHHILETKGVTPALLAFWRDAATFLVLFLWHLCVNPKALRVRGRDFPILAVMGLVLGISHVFWNLGVNYSGPAVSTVQQAATPAIVAIVARLLWGETLDWAKAGAVLLTFLGTAITVSGGNANGNAIAMDGLIIGFGIPFSYAGWSLFGKKLRFSYSAPTILTYAFGFAALVLSPIQISSSLPSEVPPSIIACFCGLILVSTIGGFVLFTMGIGRIPVSTASVIAMVEIIFVSIFSLIFLGEAFTTIELLGAGLIICGVIVLLRPGITGSIKSRWLALLGGAHGES